MKKYILVLLILFTSLANAQSTVNSGSLIASNGMISVGEIVITPQNATQSSSGIIGILAQVNSQTLEVSQFELTENITVFPNPTVAKISFSSKNSLKNQKVMIYNEVGQLISEKQIDSENTLDLEELSNGIYLIRFSDKDLKTFKIIKK